MMKPLTKGKNTQCNLSKIFVRNTLSTTNIGSLKRFYRSGFETLSSTLSRSHRDPSQYNRSGFETKRLVRTWLLFNSLNLFVGSCHLRELP